MTSVIGAHSRRYKPVQSAINASAMSYALRFYIYLFVADVIAVVIAVWLSPFGLIVNLVFAFVLAYLTVVVGRWVLGQKNL
jgi:hypothetical protein